MTAIHAIRPAELPKDREYIQRMGRALTRYGQGRRSLRELREAGVVVRERQYYRITEGEVQSCCFDCLQESGYIPRHLATARHIAIAERVGHSDLLREAAKRFLERRRG